MISPKTRFAGLSGEGKRFRLCHPPKFYGASRPLENRGAVSPARFPEKTDFSLFRRLRAAKLLQRAFLRLGPQMKMGTRLWRLPIFFGCCKLLIGGYEVAHILIY